MVCSPAIVWSLCIVSRLIPGFFLRLSFSSASASGCLHLSLFPGCQSKTACNYNAAATDAGVSCVQPDGICNSCSGKTDGTGTKVDNDADNDGVCDPPPAAGEYAHTSLSEAIAEPSPHLHRFTIFFGVMHSYCYCGDPLSSDTGLRPPFLLPLAACGCLPLPLLQAAKALTFSLHLSRRSRS